MAGAQRRKARSSQARKATPDAAVNGRPEPTAGEHMREAVSEWAKAARFAGAALAPVLKGRSVAKAAKKAKKADAPSLKDRLNPAKTDKGGRVGDAVDAVLDKTGGKAGTVASKLSLGSRLVERLRRGSKSGGGDEQRSNGAGDEADFKRMPVPIQESMHVARPIEEVYELARKFEDYPEFLDRVEDASPKGKKSAVFEVKVRGTTRSVPIEIADERPNRRIDWEATEGLEHSGVVSFHELAPSLTHIELTVDLEPHGLIHRLARSTHITQHAIRVEMHRFKAWAELAEDDGEPEDVAEEKPPEESPEAAAPEGEEDVPEGYDEEEPEAEEDELEEPEDFEEEEEDEEDYEDEDLEEPVAEDEYDEPDMEYEDEEEEQAAPARAR
jgi:uncharacterized membrane protein